eukprot:7391155-Prymnesium_polylepis.1
MAAAAGRARRWPSRRFGPLMTRQPEGMSEVIRWALTALSPLQSSLPPALAKQWRLTITLLFQAIPAIDPGKDPYLTSYELPARCRPPAAAGQTALLITGGTGFVGVHLIDHLLRTTTRRLFVLVRAKSAGKIQREAARYSLSLPGFDERVTLLDGDCKRADLGLDEAQWAELAGSLGAVFHLAANSSFIATFEVLRGEWMPSFVRLLEFCGANGVAFHMVGSVGRFAVAAPENRTRRGVWTS